MTHIINIKDLFSPLYYTENPKLALATNNVYLSSGTYNSISVFPVCIKYTQILNSIKENTPLIVPLNTANNTYNENTISDVLCRFAFPSAYMQKVSFRGKETYYMSHGIMLDENSYPLAIACYVVEKTDNKPLISLIIYIDPKVFNSSSNVLKRFREDIISLIADINLKNIEDIEYLKKDFIISSNPCTIQICKIPNIFNFQNTEKGLTFEEIQYKCKILMELKKDFIMTEANKVFS
jgi:hypothetical protein